MIGLSESGEQQTFVKPDLSSDKEKNILEVGSSPSGLLATLRKEVHTLADDSLSETEQSQQLATRENVYDEHGNIIDILFHQSDKSINLKSLLPGTYTIEIIDDEKANSKADKKANKISVNASNGRDFNLALLHEAGHMVDYQRNQSQYQKLEKEALKSRLSKLLLTSKIIEIRDGKKLLPETLSFCQEIIEVERENFTSEEIEEITKTFEQSCQYLTKEHTLEEFSQERDMQATLLLRNSTIEKVQHERNAWTNALRALRELQRQGITAFAGTRVDLFQAIDRALNSYEFFSGENLLSTDRHFTKGLPVK